MVLEPECGNASERHLLVFVALHAGYADGTYNLALVNDLDAALDRKGIREVHHPRALLHGVLPDLAGPVGDGREPVSYFNEEASHES
jgi:hypothetical protein